VTSINDNIWKECNARIKEKISAENYSIWFEPMRLHAITQHELILTVPNTFYKDCLEQNYLDMMQSTLDSFIQPTIIVTFILEDNTLNQQDKPIAPQLKRDKEKTAVSLSPSSSTVNPKYTFDNFVVGSSNQFAHAAALSVADNPKITYNPLFIYGGVGLGKHIYSMRWVIQC